jgi:putative oxidoreductase
MTRFRSIDTGLLILRSILGLVFAIHGAQKLFVFGYAGTAGMLDGLGVPLPGLNALALIAVELGGGVALLAGLGTRVTSLLLTFAMLVATFTVHAANGFFMSTNGYEYPLTLAVASLALAFTGAGLYSVDGLLRGRPHASQPAPRVDLDVAA